MEEILEEKKDQEQEIVAGGDTGTPENSEEQPVEAQPEEENNVPVEKESSVEENPVESESEPEAEAEPEENSEPEEKMLTQSQVNELVGKARAEGRAAAMKELFGRYGVSDDNEMNDIFGKGQGYDVLSDEYNALNGNYKNLSAENALLKSGVKNDRWEDVKAILGNKGLDVTFENIEAEFATHPEWKEIAQNVEPQSKELSPETMENLANTTKPGQMDPGQTAKIRKFGGNAPETKVDTEENDAMKYFGLK